MGVWTNSTFFNKFVPSIFYGCGVHLGRASATGFQTGNTCSWSDTFIGAWRLYGGRSGLKKKKSVDKLKRSNCELGT